MKSWFPLPRSLMEDPLFIMLTPAEKLYAWLLLSEWNERGGSFYKADVEFAVALGLSTDKVRRARRLLTERFWIKTSPGFQGRGRNLATTYLAVDFGQIREGEFFCPLHRYAFHALLARVRCHEFTHADVVTYVCLAYLRHRYCQLDRNAFFVTKRELRDISGLPSALACLTRLYTTFQFTGAHHLFEYRDEYHRIWVEKWSTFADPSEDETNAKLAESYRAQVQALANARRHPTPTRLTPRRRARSCG